MQQIDPFPASGLFPLWLLYGGPVGDLLCGTVPHFCINSLPCLDGHSACFRSYHLALKAWLDLVNKELPPPCYAKIICYKLPCMIAWNLEIATTLAEVLLLKKKCIFVDALPWGNFKGGEHLQTFPGARAMYGRYA